MIAKNDFSLPLITMSESFRRGKGMNYMDFHIPFFTPLSFGLSRFLWLYCCLSYLFSDQKLIDHIKSNAALYFYATVGTGFVVLSGLRNVLLWPGIFFVFGGWIKNRKINTRYITIGLFAFLVIFIGLGNYRIGFSDALTKFQFFKLDIPILDDIFLWASLYFTPCYSNFDHLIREVSSFSYGLVFLSECLPNVLIKLFGEVPDSSIAFLKGHNLLMYYGFTFRTIFSDLYIDFGYFGSLLILSFIYTGVVYLFNKSCDRQLYLALYMLLLPGFLFIPFLNRLTTMVALLPILMTFFLCEI